MNVWGFSVFAGILALFSGIQTAPAWAQSAAGPGEAPVALVYKGPGSCEDGCSEAAAAVATRAGFRVKYVTAKKLEPKVFEGATLWIQPGGNAITVSKTLGTKRLALIREFVAAGGGYVGFCAGAFLADRTVDNPETIPGLGLLPISTRDYEVDQTDDGTVIPVTWGRGERSVYFNGGGSFVVDGHPAIRVLSYYEKVIPAAVYTRFGHGHVAVSGFHPEAFPDWKRDTGMNDADGDDYDIAHAMVELAVPSMSRELKSRRPKAR